MVDVCAGNDSLTETSQSLYVSHVRNVPSLNKIRYWKDIFIFIHGGWADLLSVLSSVCLRMQDRVCSWHLDPRWGLHASVLHRLRRRKQHGGLCSGCVKTWARLKWHLVSQRQSHMLKTQLTCFWTIKPVSSTPGMWVCVLVATRWQSAHWVAQSVTSPFMWSSWEGPEPRMSHLT